MSEFEKNPIVISRINNEIHILKTKHGDKFEPNYKVMKEITEEEVHKDIDEELNYIKQIIDAVASIDI